MLRSLSELKHQTLLSGLLFVSNSDEVFVIHFFYSSGPNSFAHRGNTESTNRFSMEIRERLRHKCVSYNEYKVCGKMQTVREWVLLSFTTVSNPEGKPLPGCNPWGLQTNRRRWETAVTRVKAAVVNRHTQSVRTVGTDKSIKFRRRKPTNLVSGVSKDQIHISAQVLSFLM